MNTQDERQEVNRAGHMNREEMLLRMYDQLFNDINRHIVVIWQSVGVVVGSFALFALTEKRVITLDVATSLVVLISAWLLAHCYDASYWYNRNLVIIANIERLFLEPSDLHDVHYYFGKHRRSTAMLTHLRIQYCFGVFVAVLVLAHHCAVRIIPWAFGTGKFGVEQVMPCGICIVAFLLLWKLRCHRLRSYSEFLKESPGIAIDTNGVEYGVGHPIEKQRGCEKSVARDPHAEIPPASCP